jgi:hypothetical protein
MTQTDDPDAEQGGIGVLSHVTLFKLGPSENCARVMPGHLPQSVRYMKNGAGGKWWTAAKDRGQLHFGWWFLPRDLLQQRDLDGIKACIGERYKKQGAATADFNAIKLVIEHPSQHIWVTFEDGYLWWCTVHDGIAVNLDMRKEKTEGSFWLTCNIPWSNHSVGGRLLARSELPGTVGAVAGFRATVCEPKGSPDILRLIQDKKDPDAVLVIQTRKAYTAAVAKLVRKLHDRDFELLIDLVLARTGWTRLAKLGGVTEGIDIEAENVAANEIAFVQVKSKADQGILNDYIQRFQARRERYHRMIFAVHEPLGILKPPAGEAVQIWSGERVAQLAVQLGLGDWIANRL